jgi:hypothetical protein
LLAGPVVCFHARNIPESGAEEKRADRANVRNRLNNWLKLTSATIGLPPHPERRNLMSLGLANEPPGVGCGRLCKQWPGPHVQLLYANNQGKPKVTAACGGPGFGPSWVRSNGLVPFSFAKVGIAGNPAWSA